MYYALRWRFDLTRTHRREGRRGPGQTGAVCVCVCLYKREWKKKTERYRDWIFGVFVRACLWMCLGQHGCMSLYCGWNRKAAVQDVCVVGRHIRGRTDTGSRDRIEMVANFGQSRRHFEKHILKSETRRPHRFIHFTSALVKLGVEYICVWNIFLHFKLYACVFMCRTYFMTHWSAKGALGK